jgi:endonuclease YncB( thermonuclease family)
VDGKDVSLKVIGAGMAWYHKESEKDKLLAKAHKRAKKEKKGLWAQPNPVAPWVYRKTHTEEKE